MNHIRSIVLVAAVGLLAACSTPAPRAPATQARVDAYVAEATRLAGEDLKGLLPLCNAAAVARPPQETVDQGIATQIARPPPAPGKAFDNLFYVGSAWVSAWALTTPDGVILIDALNNQLEAMGLIEGGMRKLGLDPAAIRYVVVTHGHGDHYGGVNHLVDRYRPRVVMSDLDWTMTATQLEFASRHWGAPPRRGADDVAVRNGDNIALGGSRMVFHVTPGHTLGTITPVFDVKYDGRTHRALLWGGTAFNFGNNLPRLDSYIEATDRMAALAERENIDVMLSNHPGYDGTVAKMGALQRAPSAANPFVIGTPNVVRSLRVMGACARAQRDRFAMLS